MKRTLWTKLLIEVGNEQAIKMANEIIGKYDVLEIQSPRQGLTMIKMRESSQNSLFYIGEVLITETKVKIGDAIGIGIVMEDDEELSRALAVIDAAFKGCLQETKSWQLIFEELERKLYNQLEDVKCSIERTKVNFETMRS
nr:phosphonate C-P lyase system protein PhnG [Lysinibacillus timonensis]